MVRRMYKVDVYLRVRRAVMVEGMSIREASRVFGLHQDTVSKMLAYSVPPGYRRQSPAASQSFDKLRRSHLRASSTASSKTITRFPRSSATPPSASSSGSGTSMASTAVTPSSRTTSVSTAASLVHELIEARDERRLLNLQRQLSRLNLLIIDELGFVPLSCTGRNCSSRFSASATSGDPSW